MQVVHKQNEPKVPSSPYRKLPEKTGLLQALRIGSTAVALGGASAGVHVRERPVAEAEQGRAVPGEREAQDEDRLARELAQREREAYLT